ncbi:MAG: protease complex subunit PrcB family protein [Lachnospiraceae bacterium]
MKQYLMVAVIVFCALLYGCSSAKDDGKLEDLDFTVVEENKIPEELKQMIDQKKKGEFTMTYQDGNLLYIVVGYGEQNTGGYSIEVPAFYLTKDAIVIDTNLLGPGSDAVTQASYPVIVVMTEFRDLPVLYK